MSADLNTMKSFEPAKNGSALNGKRSLLNENGPHVFFSPHADDVVLSCGDTIHSLVLQGKVVRVIGVFAGVPAQKGYSAFARHLHRKWHLRSDAIRERWQEDKLAMKELGITAFEHWDYFEAPYRRGTDGLPLYLGNEELTADLTGEDCGLRDRVLQAVQKYCQDLPPAAVFYFPLALGKHVDHQILFDVGLQLSSCGRQVRFYEDYPYAQAYEVDRQQNKWQPESVSIALSSKVRAATAYTSQLRGLGGSAAVLEQRLQTFGATVGGERYWQLSTNGAKGNQGSTIAGIAPLARKQTSFRLRDFGKFLKTFRWHDLDEILPVGDGVCIDIGCGPARHRALIEERGYRWFGIDRRASGSAVTLADAGALPHADQTVTAVVAWQMVEYLQQPEQLFAEAARVIEPGGVFCGSVSFLEPVHGQTYFNLSPLALRHLLTRHGFADVEVKPGLNGFALLLWTWLSRSGIPSAARLAIPIAFCMLAPLAGVIFLVSWLHWRFARGSGHAIRWLSETAPLEFAGHVMFAARQTSRKPAVSTK